MQIIDYQYLRSNLEDIRSSWRDPSKPYRYVYFDNLIKPEYAEKIYQEYPDVYSRDWSYKTYINQKNKFVMTRFGQNMPTINDLVNELNAQGFLAFLEEVTGIDELVCDRKLFGGGLHQSINGAFLDVHVDFNIHPETKFHRRMNLIVFFNKDWKKEYEGYLELWDMEKRKRIENISPDFNRCVIFETNEISFHGHPKPLNTPQGTSRKSIALYYYTQDRPKGEIAQEHNTIYVNTQGASGWVKNLRSSVKALLERLKI